MYLPLYPCPEPLGQLYSFDLLVNLALLLVDRAHADRPAAKTYVNLAGNEQYT